MHNAKVPVWPTTRPLRHRTWARIENIAIAAAVPDTILRRLNKALASQFGVA